MTSKAVEAQVEAADPAASSWVSANAGSGKTRVLTDRVARLLLAGTEPERILCLTYTKAAAAEMQNRLFRTLGDWAMRDDDALREALTALGEPAAGLPAAALARARTLFARALETPGGLKIQTIHAFCETLLRRFPLEAQVAPQFAVLDDRQARELRAEVLDELAESHAGVFASLARLMNGDDPDQMLQEIGQTRAGFAGPLDRDVLAAAFNVTGVTSDALRAEVIGPDEAAICALLPRLQASGTQDQQFGTALANALLQTDVLAQIVGIERVLLTKEGTPRKKFPSAKVQREAPSDCAKLTGLLQRIEAARPKRLGLPALENAEALGRFARLWLDAFAARKRDLGRLDFDDMIDRARELLERPGTAAWVLWRLDGGIDHILVDEAQDTSPAQWRVIEALTAEFFAGEGARAVERTLFVVGDEKQSIYSFQGADPAEFGQKNRQYARALEDLGRSLAACNLLYSFRSAQPILALVDQVFSGPAKDGLSGEIHHVPFHPDMPGRVELWPWQAKEAKAEEPPWHEPSGARMPPDPVEDLADRIAVEIAGWLAAGRLLPGEDTPRPIRAGDVMILVQRRGPVFHAVIRALKRRRVPVAGADLLRIGGELAVNDLLAALRVAATPGDDLSLAALLRSPLGGLSERDLFELAHPRPEKTQLRHALADAPAGAWPEIRALLDDLRRTADFLRPFELLERILIRHGGRSRLVARLGAEAEDGIDALLDQALAYEQVEPPSLTGFLDWIDRADVTVKRRTEAGTDQVRVMTVHGAKGLEAPIVILPDTGARELNNYPLMLRLGDGPTVWRGRTEEAPPVITSAQNARRELLVKENRRLLYVALTRAQRWLIVCGAGPALKDSTESWHALVAEALTRLGADAVAAGDGDRLVLTHAWNEATTAAAPGTGAAPAPLPAWARTPAPRAAAAGRSLSPSSLGGTLALVAEAEPGGLAPDAAKARGTALHRLLEHLHGHPPGARAALAARLLPGAPDLDGLLAEAAAVLDAPGLAHVFGPDSLAEVDVAARLPGGQLLGRLDRLLVEPSRVLAIDFKSNRAVPAAPDAIPEGILRQLGAYRAALRRIWTDRPVETAVLWTRTGRLMPVPDALADAAFARADLDPEGVGS